MVGQGEEGEERRKETQIIVMTGKEGRKLTIYPWWVHVSEQCLWAQTFKTAAAVKRESNPLISKNQRKAIFKRDRLVQEQVTLWRSFPEGIVITHVRSNESDSLRKG